MTGSINPINTGTSGINGPNGYGAPPSKKENEKEVQKETQVQAAETKTVDAEKVFTYLSASAASVVPQKTINPATYVDEASVARIESLMAGFEDKVAEGLKAFDAEFASMNVSEGAKMNVVLKQIESEI